MLVYFCSFFFFEKILCSHTIVDVSCAVPLNYLRLTTHLHDSSPYLSLTAFIVSLDVGDCREKDTNGQNTWINRTRSTECEECELPMKKKSQSLRQDSYLPFLSFNCDSHVLPVACWMDSYVTNTVQRSGTDLHRPRIRSAQRPVAAMTYGYSLPVQAKSTASLLC